MRPILRPVLAVAILLAVAIGLRTALVPADEDRATAPVTPAPVADPWAAYKERFVAPEGRVVDTGNDGISHSEGQGWGMLLAEAHDDRETFERLWEWTQASLQWRGARLFAWKWDPTADHPIVDANNATDGDLLIAWALDRAAARWDVPAWREEARGIARDIRRLTLMRHEDLTALLPAFDGFERDGGVIVNLSYYVFPALEAMDRLDPAPDWDAALRSGLALVERARIGDWGLPPDWMAVTEGGTIGPAAGWPPRFGYEAVRVPLYLAWAGRATPETMDPFHRFWSGHADAGGLPAWIDLATGEVGAARGVAGYEAVARLSGGESIDAGFVAAAMARAPDYYAASLLLLAEVAAREGGRRG